MTAVDVRHLSFAYSGRKALEDVSFSIAEGECVGLIGPNGAGKSTLLLHLNGILPEKPGEGGAVRIFDQPVCKASLHDIRRQVGLLFQNPDDQLFCPTVFEDVSFGPRQFGREEAELQACADRALRVVGLAGFQPRSPHHLSHGEKRRVCMAGVLACEPRILLLDEPTSGLDPRGRREIKSLLQDMQMTKLIASHDLELIVELCGRVIVMDRGSIVAEGPATELLSDEPLMLAHGLECPHAFRSARGPVRQAP